jgi:hypothetical protein
MDKNFHEETRADGAALIAELKTAQAIILDLLARLQAVSHTYALAKPVLRDLSNILLNHFEKQNRKLVGFLQDIMVEHDEDSPTAHFLLQDLKEIKIKTWFFIDEHPADMGDIHPKNFLADLKGFSASLTARIKTEREQLIALIEKRWK